MLADGTRVTGDEIHDWFDADRQPTLSGRPVFDAKNSFRWVIDTSRVSASLPEAYIEFIGGDRLPGVVVGFAKAGQSPYESLQAHLIVEPRIEIPVSGHAASRPIRVLAEWVRRVVWQPRRGSRLAPSHLALRDGGQLPFRSLRWTDGAVLALTDEGIQTIPFHDIAEVHLRSADPWNAYFSQLAVLSPSGNARLLQAETTEGLKVTTSTERFRPRHHGGEKDRKNWQQVVQPAWSLDPLAIRFETIRTWRFWPPHQVPLTVFAPVAIHQDSAFGGSWQWRVDSNLDGRPLRSGGQDFGWGFGVHASNELHFALPSSVKSFRTRVGLDRTAGDGGCVRAVVWRTSKRGSPLYRSGVLVGAGEVADSDTLTLKVPAGSGDRLVLRADAAHAERPADADPFDIRDSLDWLEPEFQLDENMIKSELAKRVVGQLPAWTRWAWEGQRPAGELFRNTWDESDPGDPRFRLQVMATGGPVRLSRTVTVGDGQSWLMICVSRLDGLSTASRVKVRVEGQELGEFDVPLRKGHTEPDPLLVSISQFRSKTVAVELLQSADGDRSFVDWRAVAIVDRRPGLLRVFEDEPAFAERLTQGKGSASFDGDDRFEGSASIRVTGPERSDASLPGLSARIRESPRLGEFRYLRFAWKKTTGERICLQLAHDGRWAAEPDEPENVEAGSKPRRRSQRRRGPAVLIDQRGQDVGYRYDAGKGDRLYGSAKQVADRLPEQWTVVTRDLYADFGNFTLTGLMLRCPDGDSAWFDHLYLGRSTHDFDHIKELISDDRPAE